MSNSTSQPSTKLVRASARHLHISPRKMRLVTSMVQGLNAADAIVQLQHTEKKASDMLIKLIKSAIANAKNNFSLDESHLYIKSISTDMGKTMKRFMARARGSASPIQRKMSHVNIILEERKQGKASKSRVSFLSRKPAANVDQQEAVAKPAPKEENKKPQLFKTEEQIKMNKIQNKRRLFNRKSGE